MSGNVTGLADSPHHLRCSADCGFVVGDDYFRIKTQYTAALCPRCGAPVRVVEPFTNTKARNLMIDPRNGRIVAEGKETTE